MTRGLWKIVSLGAIGTTVFVTAFTLDDCDPGEQPPAPNDIAETTDDDAENAQRWTCPMQEQPVEHNAVPQAFVDKPVLAGLLAKVNADLKHPEAIRAAIVKAARDVKESRMIEFLTECGLPQDSHYGTNGIRLFLPCLANAAQSLADFRAAAEQVIARLMLVVPPSLHSDVAIKAYLLLHLLHPGECENEEQHRQRVREVQEACGLPAVTGTVGPRTENCIRDIAARMALERGFYLTGPTVCENIEDSRWSDVPYELGWYVTVPRGTIREEN